MIGSLTHNLSGDSERRLRTKLYYKRDDFNCTIVNIPFICSNIPAASALWSIHCRKHCWASFMTYHLIYN